MMMMTTNDDIDPPDDYFPDEDGGIDLLSAVVDNHPNNPTDSAIHYSQLSTSTSQLQKWSRKPTPPNLNNQTDIHFQWLDIDMTNHSNSRCTSYFFREGRRFTFEVESISSSL